MAASLDQCLADLSNRIDEEFEQNQRARWQSFLAGELTEGYFDPPARQPNHPAVDWPKITVNQAIKDTEAMLLQQFGLCSDTLTKGAGEALCVRCNYGTAIVPSLFGCEIFWMDEKLETLPTNHPLHDADKIRDLIHAGVPNLSNGFGKNVFETATRFLEIFDHYPILKEHVHLYHPDWQGPMDNTETTWGSDVFLAFYDNPDLVRDFLELQTQTYAAAARAWFDLVGWPQKYNVHWGFWHQGGLALRNDSLMNLSPQLYVDFARPMDQRLLDEFNGGINHSCGKGDHYLAEMTKMKGLTAVHLSQPEYNDMELVYQSSVDKGLKLLALKRDIADAAIAAGRPLRGQVFVVD